MSAISQKSITGITSITTPAGVDNQLTLHNNNTTEAVKLDVAGNLHFHNHLNITGVSTASNFKTGTSNLHNTGLNVQDLDVDGHTNLDNVSIAGVTTFTGTSLFSSNIQIDGITDFNNIFRVGDIGGFPSTSQSSRITRKGNHPAGLTFDHGSSPTLEIGSKVGEVVIGSNSYGNAPINFKTGVTLGTLSGGTTQMQISPTGINIIKDLDVDGHTNLDNVSIAGVTTFTNTYIDFKPGNGGNAHFRILSTGTGDAGIFFDAANGDIAGSDYVFIGQNNNLDFVINPNANAGNIDFQRAGTTQLRIDSAGRVMIGNTAAASFNSSTNQLVLGNGVGNNGMVIYTGASHSGSLIFNDVADGTFQGGLVYKHGSGASDNELRIYTNAAQRFNITKVGDLLQTWRDGAFIGTRYDSDYYMGLTFGASSRTLFIDNRSNDTRADIVFRTIEAQSAPVERVRITSDGHTLFSGLTTNNDPRNVTGISVKSTGGVSFQNYGSNGSRNWRIRPDDMSRWGDLDFSVSPTANSATDWPDAASDKVLTLGYDGTVTKPRNPCFQAVVNGSHISAGSYVVFGSADINIGNDYDTSNGIFTAPVAGTYLFHISSIAFNNKTTVYRFYLRINNGNTGSGNDAHLRIDRSNNGYANQYGTNASYTYYKYMNANDTARVYFTPDDNSANAYGGADYFKFSGHLVG